MEPTVKLQLDETAWKKTIEDATSLYREYPDVQTVSASLRFSAVNEYLVNSEGTVTRNGKTTYSVTLNSTAQADDGMRLGRNPYWMVAKAEELPSREKLMGESKKMLDTLVALRKAPIVEEEYRGPVLFAPDAANDVIASLIGANVLGRKPQLGTAEPDDRSVCDELQDARAADIFDGGRRSDDERIWREESRRQLRGR